MIPVYNIGDKVIITDNTCNHGFYIGEIVVISYYQQWSSPSNPAYGYDGWSFGNDDCKLYKPLYINKNITLL